MIRNLSAALLLLVAAAPGLAAPPLATTATEDDYWAQARAALDARLKLANRPKRAKNVILFIGDGMGISTIAAARIFDAQQRSKDSGFPLAGEDNSLSFEKLPYSALVKTYNTNAQVPDSAGTASAMNTGIKTRIGYLNLRQDQDAATCARPAEFPATFAEIAKRQGMAVGVVTTTRITHATPAAVFAHVPNRNWEGADAAFPPADRKSGCPDIARQLVTFAPGGGIDLALGGGRARFVPVESGGMRDDGADLVADWQRRSNNAHYLRDRAAMLALAPATPGPVLGLFAEDHLAFEVDRDPAVEPSLEEMTVFAIARLQAQSPKGYYLMVEGGRIDHAHHLTNPYRALSETQEFSQAIAAALSRVNLDDTLVLVTADHGHVMTFAGYSERGNNILGYVRPVAGGESRTALSPEGYALDDRGEPMTTLSYANGPFTVKGLPLSHRLAPTDKNYLSAKTFGLDSETHSGEDVALFAAGPRADLVGGVIEQNLIFHVMAEAMGWR